MKRKGFRFSLAVVALIGAAVTTWWLWPEPKRGENAAPMKSVRIREAKSVTTADADRRIAEEGREPAKEAVRSSEVTASDETRRDEVRAADVTTNVPPKRAESVSDQLLEMALEMPTDGSRSMAPMPIDRGAEAAFRKSLETKIVINDSDPEWLKERKMALQAVREEMAEMLRQGNKFHEVLAEHQKVAEENFQTRLNAIREAKEIFKQGDIEGTRKYVNTINFAFQQMGIKEIEMPRSPAVGQ